MSDLTDDCFASHDWQPNENGRANHKEVLKVVRMLTESSELSVWVDEDRMEGNILTKMAEGIDKSRMTLVFVTKAYHDKVASKKQTDNCHLEFTYAATKRASKPMLAVVMEKRMKSPEEWTGPLGFVLAACLFHDLSDCLDDDILLKLSVHELARKIRSLLGPAGISQTPSTSSSSRFVPGGPGVLIDETKAAARSCSGAENSPELQAVREALQGMGMNDASAAEALVKYGAEKAEDIFILDEADVNKLMEKPYGLKPLPAKKLLKRLKELSEAKEEEAAQRRREAEQRDKEETEAEKKKREQALALAVKKGYVTKGWFATNVNSKVDKHGNAALHLAAEKSDGEDVSLLLAAGAIVDANTNDGRTALHQAAMKGNEKGVCVLLRAGADIEAKTKLGQTPLMFACYHGHEGTAKLLVENRADVNATDSAEEGGDTPLSFALRGKRTAIAQWLASIGARDKEEGLYVF